MWYRYGLKLKNISYKLNRIYDIDDNRICDSDLFINNHIIKTFIVINGKDDNYLSYPFRVNVSDALFQPSSAEKYIKINLVVRKNNDKIYIKEIEESVLLQIVSYFIHEFGHYMQEKNNTKNQFFDIYQHDLTQDNIKDMIISHIDNLEQIVLNTLNTETNAEKFSYNFDQNAWSLFGYNLACNYQRILFKRTKKIIRYIERYKKFFSLILAYKNKYGKNNSLYKDILNKILESNFNLNKYKSLNEDVFISDEEFDKALAEIADALIKIDKRLNRHVRFFPKRFAPKKIGSVEDVLSNDLATILLEILKEAGAERLLSFRYSELFGKENHSKFLYCLRYLFRDLNNIAKIKNLPFNFNQQKVLYMFSVYIYNITSILFLLSSTIKDSLNILFNKDFFDQELKKTLSELNIDIISLINQYEEVKTIYNFDQIKFYDKVSSFHSWKSLVEEEASNYESSREDSFVGVNDRDFYNEEIFSRDFIIYFASRLELALASFLEKYKNEFLSKLENRREL